MNPTRTPDRSWLRVTIAGVTFAVACGGGGRPSTSPSQPSGNATTLTIATSSAPFVGGTSQFTATLRFDDGTRTEAMSGVVWSSDDPSVLTISDTGSARGVALGTVTVRATVGTLAAQLPVTVTARPASFVLSGPETLEVGEPASWLALTQDFGRGGRGPVNVTWESESPDVVHVAGMPSPSNRATVTGLRPGQATIVATNFVDEQVRKTVTVADTKYAPPMNLTLTGYDALPAGQPVQFQTTAVWPEAEKDVTNVSDWFSSDPAVATVSPLGLVSPIGPGTTEIRSVYVGVMATSRVKVIGPPGDAVVVARSSMRSTPAGDAFSAEVTAAVVLDSSKTGLIGVELRDQAGRALTNEAGNYVPHGSSLRGGNATVRFPLPGVVVTICAVVWLRPSNALPVFTDVGCTPVR